MTKDKVEELKEKFDTLIELGWKGCLHKAG